jgi:hypothetical protein
MNLPIQSAPIDRANRAINMQASAVPGIAPALGAGDIVPIICAICKIVPNLPFCPILCPTA